MLKLGLWAHGPGRRCILLGNVFSYLLDNINFLTRELATNNLTLDDLIQSFNKYGGTARNLLNKSQRKIDQEIANAIRNCTDLMSLFPSSTGFKDDTSHALILIDPIADHTGVLQRDDFQGRIASRHVCDLVLASQNQQLVNSMKNSFQMLLQSDISRGTSGILFEKLGHPYLVDSLIKDTIGNHSNEHK